MNTPWINYDNMWEINSEQKSVYKRSQAQKETNDNMKEEESIKRTIELELEEEPVELVEVINVIESDHTVKDTVLEKLDIIHEGIDDDYDESLETDHSFNDDNYLHYEELSESKFVESDGNDGLDQLTVIENSEKPNEIAQIHLWKGKIPFSTFVEVDHFLHPLIFGSSSQDTFEFIDPNNKQIPAFDTKLFHTIACYHEGPYCHLVSFSSHDILYMTKTKDPYAMNIRMKKGIEPAVLTPIPEPKSSERFTNWLNLKVPVVAGEYKIELCLEEEIGLKEDIDIVKNISKEVTLISGQFVPTKFTDHSEMGFRSALKGKLFLDGYIEQIIEYVATYESTLKEEDKRLHQKTVLELIIQLLQIQKI
ncbi:BC_2427 family protein [Halalkalibacter nanhaiisediminis]|uniref:DUF7852 domain-containing protein n=1 Tax=Halalkalibacter nanhaiisediminis TaxID=688079 RepID=A0A562QTK9_9BACI|nr:hypothetical protein [Halalkalibacter nanhaiisediminis]TWI60057.1 hypothetical protein IQ10_00481 [Halalkalibacter nanhaiisediminis]